MTTSPKQRGGARPNTGGARAGAGRPATGRAVTVAASLSPTLVAKLDEVSGDMKISRSAIIAEALTQWAMTH